MKSLRMRGNKSPAPPVPTATRGGVLNPQWNKNIIFKVTLESGDKSISYAYIVKKSVSSLYGKGTAVVNVPINTLSNVYAETVSDTSITLRWDQAAWATGGYNVYRSSDGANYAKVNASPIPLTAAADAPAVTYEDTGLSPAHTYYYYVKGILAGDAEGEATYLGSIQTKYETPTGVTASFSGGYPLRNYVSWSAVPYGQNSYTRYYNVYRNGEYITNTSSTYYYDNVQFDSTYTYTVVAWGSDGENSAESASSATILTPQISDISRNSFTENYISTGEYQYFRVYTAQNYSYNYFNLSSTNAEIYVQAGSDYNFPSNSTTYYSGAGGSPLYIYNSYYPVIVVVRGDSDGSYSFSVD
ncbi:MAG: hypothetical protein LBF60_03485 [Treponema sp.]|nr:hypothetical protein [Treponema sp.]